MAYVSFEVVPVNGSSPEQFNRLREVIEYLNERLYENFYIQINTTYDYQGVIEKVQEELYNNNIQNVIEVG